MIILRNQNRFRVGLSLGLLLLFVWSVIAFYHWQTDHRLPPSGARLIRAEAAWRVGSARASHKAGHAWNPSTRLIWPVRESTG